MRGVRMTLLAGAVAVTGLGAAPGVRASSNSSGGPTALPCDRGAIQKALDTGGAYTLDCTRLNLDTPLVMSHGEATLEGGTLDGGTAANGTPIRVFIVMGGSLTLVDVTVAGGAARPVGGSIGQDGQNNGSIAGAAGSNGASAGASGTDGGAGAAGGAGTDAVEPSLDRQNPGGGAERGGCMTIGSGATVAIYGGTFTNCEASGQSFATIGGANGGNGGNGGAGGNAGTGANAAAGSGGPGGNGGNGGRGGDGGKGGNGANGISAEGGAIYNQGTLTIVGSDFSNNGALGSDGGSGGKAGAGGAGGLAGSGGDGSVGGNGGNGGQGGNGAVGGKGGDAGSGYGGAIYNDGGDLLIAATSFEYNVAEGGIGGNVPRDGCGQVVNYTGKILGCGAGGQAGRGTQGAGIGGRGQPHGMNGQPGAAGTPGNGGDAGASGDAIGGAIYSTNTVSDSDVTFAHDSLSCSCDAYTMANAPSGASPGHSAAVGSQSDPDVHGSEACPAEGMAAADRPRAATGGTGCRLRFSATVAGVLQYFPKPHRSESFFTFTIKPGRVRPTSIVISASASRVQLEPLIAGSVYPAPIPTTFGLNCVPFGGDVHCTSIDGGPIKPGQDGTIRINVQTKVAPMLNGRLFGPTPYSTGQFLVFAFAGTKQIASAKAAASPLTRAQQDRYKEMRNRDLDGAIKAIEKGEELVNPLTETKENVERAEKYLGGPAIEELFGEVAGKGFAWLGIAATAATVTKDTLKLAKRDPPRSDYRTLGPPPRWDFAAVRVPGHPAADAALQRWATLQEHLGEDLYGALVSYERAQGAQAAGQASWLVRQMQADASDLNDAAGLARQDAAAAAAAGLALRSVGVGRRPIGAATLAQLRAGFLRAYRSGAFTRGLTAYARRIGLPQEIASGLPAIALGEIQTAQPGLPLQGLGGSEYAQGDATLATILSADAEEALTDPLGSLPHP